MYINLDPNIFFAEETIVYYQHRLLWNYLLIFLFFATSIKIPIYFFMPLYLLNLPCPVPKFLPQLLNFLSSTPSIPVAHSYIAVTFLKGNVSLVAEAKGTRRCNFLKSQKRKTCKLRVELCQAEFGSLCPSTRSDFENNLKSPVLQDATTQTKVMGSL